MSETIPHDWEYESMAARHEFWETRNVRELDVVMPWWREAELEEIGEEEAPCGEWSRREVEIISASTAVRTVGNALADDNGEIEELWGSVSKWLLAVARHMRKDLDND